jgi:hypothetical protein
LTRLSTSWTASTNKGRWSSTPHFLPNGAHGGPPGVLRPTRRSRHVDCFAGLRFLWFFGRALIHPGHRPVPDFHQQGQVVA